MTKPAETSEIDPEEVERLRRAISAVIEAFLVAGREGAPAEGRLRFNPLYFHMLRLIAAAGGVRPSTVADALGVARSTISTAADALGREGLVEKTRDPEDGRAVVLSLTEEGRETVAAILRQDRRNSAALLSHIAPEERDLMLRLIEQAARGVSGA